MSLKKGIQLGPSLEKKIFSDRFLHKEVKIKEIAMTTQLNNVIKKKKVLDKES